MKKIFCMIASMMATLSGFALDATDITTYPDVVYFSDAKGMPGKQATMLINLKSSFDAAGFQLNMTTPDGISVAQKENGSYAFTLLEERTTAEAHNIFDSSLYPDGSIFLLCSSTKSAIFSDHDGAVASVKLDIDENLPLGDYYITIETSTIAAKDATSHPFGEPIQGVLHVVAPEDYYAAGYEVSIDPFAATVGQAYDADAESDNLFVNVKLTNATDISTLDFDLVLPENFGVGKYVSRRDEYYDASYAGAYESARNFPSVEDNVDGSLHVSSADATFSATDELADVISLPIVVGEGVANGIYQLGIRNIIANSSIEIVPCTVDIYVGSPKAIIDNGAINFHGNYSSEASFNLLQGAVPADDELTTIDLTNVTAVPDGATLSAQNQNALILTKKDLGLANTQNVVIGDECANLVLVDGCSFAAPIEFTAAQVSHAREGQTSKWGTVCLPYALTSDSEIQYFELESVSTEVMTFSPVETVAAGVPAVYKRLGEAQFSANATDAVIQKTTESYQVAPTELAGWQTIGFYRACKVTEADMGGELYYIASDTFKGVASEATFKAFKSVFLCTDNSSAPARFTIEENVTNIEQLEDGRIQLRIFDLNGRQQNEVNAGLQIVNDKVIMVY